MTLYYIFGSLPDMSSCFNRDEPIFQLVEGRALARNTASYPCRVSLHFTVLPLFFFMFVAVFSLLNNSKMCFVGFLEHLFKPCWKVGLVLVGVVYERRETNKWINWLEFLQVFLGDDQLFLLTSIPIIWWWFKICVVFYTKRY